MTRADLRAFASDLLTHGAPRIQNTQDAIVALLPAKGHGFDPGPRLVASWLRTLAHQAEWIADNLDAEADALEAVS